MRLRTKRVQLWRQMTKRTRRSTVNVARLRQLPLKRRRLCGSNFWKPGSIAGDAYARMNLDDWYGAEANNHILAILGKAPGDPAAIAGVTRAAQTLVAWWDANDDRK